VVTADDIRRVGDRCTSTLRDHADADWGVGIPDLDMTVSRVVAHVAETCLWYAIDLAARGKELSLIEHQVHADRPAVDLIDTLATYARIVAAVVDATSPDTRGFHPFGQADRAGFAAMACDEMLIHTDDACRGLGVTFAPDADVVEPVLRRLFPWAPSEGDPWQLLLWSNGRIHLEERPRLQKWRWHCAPLDEWDGRTP
jgi:hypothetical protein